MFSFVAKKAMGGAADKLKDNHDNAGGVNWKEFNYPPCLTVVHFDPLNDPIPVLARDTVLRMKNLWYAALFILFFNICSTIGFVAAKAEPGVAILYSMLQAVFGGVAGGAVLYQGYRGVAGDLASSSRLYLILQGCLTVLMLVFCAISSGNLHGFAGIKEHKSDRPQPGYTVMCVIEGLMWLSCAIASLVIMYLVYRYPGHERATRDAAAASTASKSDSKPARKKKSKHAPPPVEDDGEPRAHAPVSSKSKSKGKTPRAAPPEDDQV